MLRISEHQSSSGRIVKLEGKVSGVCAGQVESYCQSILAEGFPLTIDMTDVLFVDRNAVELFTRLRADGVHLRNCSPFVSELLKPIAV